MERKLRFLPVLSVVLSVVICCAFSPVYAGSMSGGGRMDGVQVNQWGQEKQGGGGKGDIDISLVFGHHTMEVPWEKAKVLVKVKSSGHSLSQALEKNQELRKSYIKKLEMAGIDRGRVEVASFGAAPNAGLSRTKVGYEVIKIIQVEVFSETQLQMIAALCDGIKDVNYGQIYFHHSKEGELKKQATGLACDDAIANKTTLEKKFGVRLEIKSINYSASSPVSKRGTQTMWSSPANYSSSELGNMVISARVRLECVVAEAQ